MNGHLFVPLIGVLLTVSAEVCLAGATTLPGITNQYRFDDGTGTTAVDSVGGNQAVLHNFGVGEKWVVGKFGSGVNYTNENAYVITDSPISASSASQFSVSFWSRLNSQPNSNDSVLVTPQLDNWITYNPTGNTNGFGKRGIGIGSIRDPNHPLLGVWENYVITYDRPSGVASVYRDGVLRDTGDVTLPSLNTRWVFGHNQGVDNTNGSWHGALDEIQFYDRVLTVSEVQMLLSDPHPQGDYNRDGIVDAADYIIWRKQVGNLVDPCTGPDANCNRFVENAEYYPWSESFGRTAVSGGGASDSAIPEPSTMTLCGLAMLALLGLTRRR